VLRFYPFAKSVLAVFLVSTLAGGTALAGSKKLDPKKSRIKFADTIDKSQRNLMLQDLETLKSLSFYDPQGKVSALFKVTPETNSMQEWLYARSKYIVPETFKTDPSTVKVIKEHHIFSNPELPTLEKGRTVDPSANIQVVMSNLGAGMYLGGKMQNAVFALKIPGQGEVPITSPRAGIFQVGAGLFQPLLKKSGGTSVEGLANSLSRLSVYFHEARHSDGNGKSLLFAHAVCPEGSAYAGYNACDKNLNGPYTIGAEFVGATLHNCSSCTESEKEALRNRQADAYSRVIAEFDVFMSDSDRMAADTITNTCKTFIDMGIDINQYDFCKNLNNPTAGTNTKQKATAWDDNPETAGVND
jgi:hypothetical protein